MDSRKLNPNPPFYLFMPQEQAAREEYETGWGVNKIFPLNGWGIATRKDYLLVGFERQTMVQRFEDIRKLPAQEAVEKYKMVQDAAWVSTAQSHLKGDIAADVQPILYRPFDTRYTLYRKELIERGDHRYNIMRHLLQDNLSLITTRITKEAFSAVAYRGLSEHKASVRYDGTFVFPLWLYPTESEAAMGIRREENIAPAFISELTERIVEAPTPENIFQYAYAVFHAPIYRTRYAAFLKTDFPRLPLPPDAETFQALAGLGAKLTALHLLEDPALQQHGIGFPIPGDHTVKKMRTTERYTPPTPGGKMGRVKLNDEEYFDNVPPEAWEFRVGGYQPAAKWLEDRTGRALTADDITHYRRMIAAMRETAALLPQVDAAFLELLAKNTEPAAEGQDAE